MKYKILKKEELNNVIESILNSDINFSYEYISTNTDETLELASFFARYVNVGDILNLNGELGAGKTVFVTGFAKFLGIESEVSSPTFTIVNEYCVLDNNKIFHFDVYRIEDSEEFIDSIGTDYFQNGICIIEWGNIIKDILPKKTINIDIQKDINNENIRIFKIWRDNK